MARSDRFFEIIQLLRRADQPLTALQIAQMLEVSRRTIYRDIATLQSMRLPILGEAGLGYVMRAGYDLPPVNFDVEEAEALMVGLSLVARTGDAALWKAARRAARKLAEAAPGRPELVTSTWGAEMPDGIDPGFLRRAIREERKLEIRYTDVEGRPSRRVVWPLALIYYVDAIVLAGWCELRGDFRHFRLDRINDCVAQGTDFAGQGAALRTRWEATVKPEAVFTRDL